MMDWCNLPSRWIAAAALSMACQVACAQIRIPAIDPTGERLFSGTTTLNPCEGLTSGLFHKKNQPAVAVAPTGPFIAPTAPVVAPPIKQPCAPPIEAVPVVPVIATPVV